MNTMPVPTTLEQQFSSLSTSEDNTKAADKENVLINAAPALVTPTKEDLRNASELDSLTSEDSVASAESPADNKFLVQKTDHKLQEERGELQPEPLLKENPHRFVIFPIQDNDVSKKRKNRENRECLQYTMRLSLFTLRT
jgi:hypothetical protein